MAASPPPDSRRTLPRLAVCVALGLAVALLPSPEVVSDAGWRLLGIFLAVIAGFILRPFPMGSTVLFGLLAAVLTKSFPTPAGTAAGREYKAQMTYAAEGFGETVVWLVVGAFLLAGAVRGTGLGRRIALVLVSRLGRSTLGLGYAQVAAELLLAPIVPSNTARGGGIVAPISQSLSRALGSEPGRSPERAGAYLSLVGAQANLITAAMFLTGMAANPLISRYAEAVYGIEFGMFEWALGALVPGLVSLALLPLVLLVLCPPSVRDGRPAQSAAREELVGLGPWTRPERVMAGVFVLLLGLWATTPWTGLDTTLVTWLGVAVLLAGGARSWQEVAGDWQAWDALMWLGGLLTLATALLEQGVVSWFAGTAEGWVTGWGALVTVLVLALYYYYSMYAFSMLTAHITALALAFLEICQRSGVEALLAVPLFAYFSNLCAATTNYSTGPVVIYFGLGYVPAPRWFRVGFLISLFHLAVWIPLGLVWWKVIGWW